MRTIVVLVCCLTVTACAPPEPRTAVAPALESPTLAARFAADRAAIVAEMHAAVKRNGQFRSATDAGEKYMPVADPEFLALWQTVVAAESAATNAVASKLDAEANKAAKQKGVRVGMTREQVMASAWGKPQQINTTTASYGTHEQWVYPGQNYLYFENGVLTTIQN